MFGGILNLILALDMESNRIFYLFIVKCFDTKKVSVY